MAPQRREGRDLALRRATFILNPAARRLPPRARIEAAVAGLGEELGLEAAFVETEAPGHARALAAEAERRGADVILACGGDGTLNEVINGIQSLGPAVGVIPGGTANVWAKEAGVPRAMERALRLQWQAPALPLDLGRVDGRRFLLMAGFGLDAEAARVVTPRWKQRLGPLAYVGAGFWVGWHYRGFRAALTFDEASPEVVTAGLMVFGNTRSYGGISSITPLASARDGLLDCVVFRGAGLLPSGRALALVLARRHLDSGSVLFRRARRVRIAPVEGTALPPFQVDGEAAPLSASEVWVEPAAVRMLVPQPRRPVFSAPEGA